MVTNYSAGADWYQVGYVRIPGDTCSHWYMQYYWNSGLTKHTEFSPGCATADTWYTLVLRKTVATETYWDAYVLTSNNCCYVWQAPNDPDTLGFSPEDGEYSSEVINEADQSGGGTSLPMYLDSAYWWDSSYNVHSTNWQGTERFCNNCDTSGPYNVTYPDGDTLKVWTDGF